MSDDSYCDSCGRRHCEPWCSKLIPNRAVMDVEKLIDAYGAAREKVEAFRWRSYYAGIDEDRVLVENEVRRTRRRLIASIRNQIPRKNGCTCTENFDLHPLGVLILSEQCPLHHDMYKENDGYRLHT